MSFIQRGHRVLLENRYADNWVSPVRVPYRVPEIASIPLLVIVDFPNATEEEQERLCVGERGQLLKAWFGTAHLDPRLFPILSVFRYRPKDNDPKHFFQKLEKDRAVCQDICGRKGTFLLEDFRNEILTLREAIVLYRPEAVLTLGPLALWAVLNHERPISEFAERPDHMCTVEFGGAFAKFVLFPSYMPTVDLHGSELKQSTAAVKAVARYVRPV